MATNVVRGVLGFATSVVITRSLSTEARGTFSFITNGTSVLIMLAGLGIASALTRAKASGSADIDQLYRASFVIGGVVGTAASGSFVLLYALTRSTLLSGITVGEASAVAVLVPPLLVLSHWTVVAYLEDRIVEISAVTIGGSLLFLALLSAGAAAGTLDAPKTIATWAVTALVPFALLVRPGRLRVGRDLRRVARDLVAYGLRTNLAVVGLILAWRVDVFFVKGFRGIRELALYAVAVGLAEIVLQVATSLRVALTPRQGDRSDRTGLVTSLATITRLTVFAGAVATLVVVPLSRVLVTGLYGERYAASAEALAWLAPGIVALVAQGPLLDFLLAEGAVRAVTWAAVLGLVANVALNAMLLPHHTFVVAAVASTATYVLSCAMTMTAFRRATEVTWSGLLLARRHDLLAIVRRAPAVR